MNTETNPVDLADLEADFADAPVEARDAEVPDGKYQVNVERVELGIAKTSGVRMLKWTLKIIAPKHEGRLLWRNNVLSSKANVAWLKTDLHLCGLDLPKLSDLQANLERLLDVKLEVTKKTKGENTNIYFNKRIVMSDAAPVEGSNGGNAHIPF